MRQWLSARHVTRQFKDSGYPSVRPESASEVFAKGVSSVPVFLRCFPGDLGRWVKRSIKAYFSEKSEDYTWTQTHSFFVLMGGFMLYVDGEPYLTLRPGYILELIRKECIDAPTLTEKQIHDKSKGNAISKGLIMLQVAWFIMQLITRAIYRLETTQLEVGTLAFAVLNFLTYAVWWNKPLNVQCPHPVYWKSTESRPEDHIDEEYDLGSSPPLHSVWDFGSSIRPPIAELIGLPHIPTSRKLRVPTFDGSIKLQGSSKTVLRLAALLMATIFGGIHCMAWFFAFPTYQEQVLWRISAVAITFTPVYILGFAYDLICLAFVMLYITARAVLLVFMFTTLRDLPPDAYKAVSWTSFVPHLYMTRTEQTLSKSYLNLLITMDNSEIGLFGTLRLMKRMTDEQVAASLIDEETVTFGRDPACTITQRSILCTRTLQMFPKRKKLTIYAGKLSILVVFGEACLTIDGYDGSVQLAF
ncbi:hypothetical protein DFJ58DRAFT_842982 [Suillus subalutaceus]|uniref:uncharacterized protein n=1 Tax=Suillus subalutaceus TaxID=48586 RepID=UPI001B875CAB|nr:uncharacterized protein DFJ58DRAFT_842982 [Suillus subalutaceus]KAG1848041.1 hypothetical protein DFJ58DRAFT_842982 [Suillus subalutaceus]